MVFKFIELHDVGWNNSSHPSWIAYYISLKAVFQLRFEHDTTSYEEPTRSYAHSSNNEHVNSFALLYGVVANQRVGGGASAMT